jgi:hypothetical protein
MQVPPVLQIAGGTQAFVIIIGSQLSPRARAGSTRPESRNGVAEVAEYPSTVTNRTSPAVTGARTTD